ncbi:hypothetical protein GCM10010345_13110 [Streptomyces canarius]|uniref:Uncharacterized protein n=1 Tax=Streptomyces canarius TaxID=285453 RepID=A0ABQ3CI77_9ACTN|nr:hypothetical protein GCM10010345_13110 [Streptomyces canarius]
MMIGLRSDPEATLFLTCQRAKLLHLPTPFPIVYLGKAYVIRTVICTGQNATIRPGCDVFGKVVRVT